MVRFLDRKEYSSTFDLALNCFHDRDFLEDFYSDDIYSCAVAVNEVDGAVVSMAMVKRVLLRYKNKVVESSYIFMVCTSPEMRHRGYMDDTILFICEKIATQTVFLIPVDPQIYKHLGFIYFWRFNEDERDMLYADDGLDMCYMKVMDSVEFEKPDGILQILP